MRIFCRQLYVPMLRGLHGTWRRYAAAAMIAIVSLALSSPGRPMIRSVLTGSPLGAPALPLFRHRLL